MPSVQPRTDIMKNHNCLDGWKCPKCSHIESFDISVEIRTIVLMTDDGYDDLGDFDTRYEDDDWARCRGCGFEATVGHFKEEMK
jgi:hypothetical protein